MSDAEDALEWQIQLLESKLPPEREYRFAPPRRWRFDFAWPGLGLAVEVEGGTWIAGRHSRGVGYAKDLEKYNRAALDGWRVIRVTPQQIESGQAIQWIEEALSSSRTLTSSPSSSRNISGRRDTFPQS